MWMVTRISKVGESVGRSAIPTAEQPSWAASSRMRMDSLLPGGAQSTMVAPGGSACRILRKWLIISERWVAKATFNVGMNQTGVYGCKRPSGEKRTVFAHTKIFLREHSSAVHLQNTQYGYNRAFLLFDGFFRNA